MFPVNGGTYNAVNKKIGKHLQTPFISSDRICIKSCGLGKERQTFRRVSVKKCVVSSLDGSNWVSETKRQLVIILHELC